MEREIIKFENYEDAQDVMYSDEWEVISDEIYDQRRWVTCYRLVVKRVSDGKFFKTYYSKGSTEQQDAAAFEYDDCIFKEVVPMEKTITVYGWEDGK